MGSRFGSCFPSKILTLPVLISSVKAKAGMTAMPSPPITPSRTASELSARNLPFTSTAIGPASLSKIHRFPVDSRLYTMQL